MKDDMYVKAYGILCRRAKCDHLEIYHKSLISVYVTSETMRSHSWLYYVNDSYAHSIEVETSNKLLEDEWMNVKCVHDYNVTNDKVKKFIVELMLRNAKQGSIYVNYHYEPFLVMHKNETIESLLIEHDLRSALERK